MYVLNIPVYFKNKLQHISNIMINNKTPDN